MATSPSANSETAIGGILRAFRYRNYRLFFFGQVVSLIGTWLSMTASSWLVYKLARHDYPESVSILLGIVGFSAQIPIFLVSPLAGVWIDRWNRHTILMVTQVLSMLQSLALAGLVLTEHISIPQIIALNAFQGLVNAFDIPARQSFVVEIIENRQDLSNAIALNSSMVHMARLVGPVVAGFLIYAVGEGYCFLIDGVSYLAVLAALGMMRVTSGIVLPTHATSVWHSLREGVSYAWGFAPVSTLLAMVAVTSLMTMSQSVLMPIFADQVLGEALGGGERTLGILLGATGVGALIGSLYLASRRSVLGLGRVITFACVLLGTALIGFSYSRILWLSLPLLMVSGGAMVVQMASCNTVLQTIVEDDKRGRVMSLFTMAFMGMTPFGSLLAGTVADYWGPAWTMRIAGLFCLTAAAAFFVRLPRLRPLIRPIYIQKGILPEVATGIQSAATQAETTTE